MSMVLSTSIWFLASAFVGGYLIAQKRRGDKWGEYQALQMIKTLCVVSEIMSALWMALYMVVICTGAKMLSFSDQCGLIVNGGILGVSVLANALSSKRMRKMEG